MPSPDNLIFWSNYLWTLSLWACFSDLDDLPYTAFEKIVFRGFQANHSNEIFTKLVIHHLFETGVAFTSDWPFQHNWAQGEHPVTVPLVSQLTAHCSPCELIFLHVFSMILCLFCLLALSEGVALFYLENMHLSQVFTLCFLLSLLNISATAISTKSELLCHLRTQGARYYLRMSLLLLSVFLARIISQ